MGSLRKDGHAPVRAAVVIDGLVEPSKDGSIRDDGSIDLSTSLWETSLTMPESDRMLLKWMPRDVGTPDAWLKRHEAMIRLTGRHPFNSEPPLPKLQAAGWITPPALHVVRNHGAVPRAGQGNPPSLVGWFPTWWVHP